MRTLVLCVLLVGCAVGRVRAPDGTEITALAVGHAKVESCPSSPCLPSESTLMCELACPPVTCTKVEGGALSSNLVEGLSLLASGFTALVTSGAIW